MGLIIYELKMLTKKLRLYIVLGLLFVQFFTSNPVDKYLYARQIGHPKPIECIVELTSNNLGSLVFLLSVFLLAEMILKEKYLELKEIILPKQMSTLNFFLNKFFAGLIAVLFMGVLMFGGTLAWQVYADIPYSHSLHLYLRDYIIDFVPMMLFSIALVFFVATLSRNTKITYVVYLVFAAVLPTKTIENSILEKIFNIYEFNADLYHLTLIEHLQMKAILILISLAMLILSYFLYDQYIMNERSGF